MGFSTTIENHPLKVILTTIVATAGITWAIGNTFQVNPLEEEIQQLEKQVSKLEGTLSQFRENSQSSSKLLNERIIELQGRNTRLELQNSQFLAENKENRSRLALLRKAHEESNRTQLILNRIAELEKRKEDIEHPRFTVRVEQGQSFGFESPSPEEKKEEDERLRQINDLQQQILSLQSKL